MKLLDGAGRAGPISRDLSTQFWLHEHLAGPQGTDINQPFITIAVHLSTVDRSGTLYTACVFMLCFE